jgi:hypothetical protein
MKVMFHEDGPAPVQQAPGLTTPGAEPNEPGCLNISTDR